MSAGNFYQPSTIESHRISSSRLFTILREFARIVPLIVAGLSISIASCDRTKPRATIDPTDVTDPVAEMRSALTAEDWERAWEHARAALITKPDDPDVLTHAAKAAAMSGQPVEAAPLMVEAAAISGFQPQRVDFAVHALINVGQLYAAIDVLRNAVAAHPDDDSMRIRLAGFLCEAQLNHQVEPHYRMLIRHRSFDVGLLVRMTDTSDRQFTEQWVESMLERNPEDQRMLLGRARLLMDGRNADEARHVVETILEHYPNFAPAHALHGQVLVALGEMDLLSNWFAATPPQAKEQVDYWLTLADWAVDHDALSEAARAYWEATRRDTNHSKAWMGLAQTIRDLHISDTSHADLVTPDQIERIEQRVADLLQLREQLTAFIWSEQKSQRRATEVARTLAALGRLWEAEAWAAVATTLNDDPAGDLATLRQGIISKLQRDSTWYSLANHAELRLDLSSLPLPDKARAAGKKIPRVAPRLITSDHLRLREESDRWGLESVGAGNNPDDPRMNPLVRSTGVGGGAIDYDLDGHCDALVMGAGGTILKSDSHPNELLRNLGSSFARIGDLAGVAGTEFGQGVCVGDYNEDGFADLFLANLGNNRLLRNNGDGTFSDCSELLDDAGQQQWTLCAAMIDVNLDGINDLLTANYCSLQGQPEKPCPNQAGELGPCHPFRFLAEPNQYLIGTAYGRLVDVSARRFAPVPAGRGMGILAGSLLKDQPAVLIANDMSRNELFTPADNGSGRFVENAAVRGVAVDGGTRPQASMGIASGDFDSDGDLDLYITGFAKEYNIYYERTATGCWRDRSASVGMVQPTLRMVGFGTAAVDLDSDGIDELAVTNGGIGDFDDQATSYEQPFQLFRRGSLGTFELLDDDPWGEYFSSLHVGRALWTLDVNGDNRNDLMITHCNEQVRLLVNRGSDQHHRISFKLIGTTSSRDAVGSVVRFNAAGRQRALWCLSGHGYMCSDEQVLRAGLGAADLVENVTVRWPDGSTDHLGSLAADSQYVIVQGAATTFKSD